MANKEVELKRRTKVALETIKQTLDTEAGEYGATLFASHHLDELDKSYWQERLGTETPKPAQVLELLCLQSHWSEEDGEGIETLDFGLPGDVSNYLLSVSFDENGEIDDISMES